MDTMQQLSFDQIEPDLFDAARRSHLGGYRGPAACQIAGITYRQLDYWARTNLVTPTLRDAAGSGTTRVYGFADLVLLKAVKKMLDAGQSLQNVRAAIDTIRDRGVDDLTGLTLFTDGTSIYEATSNEEIVDLLEGGQCVFGIGFDQVFKDVNASIAQITPSTAAADVDGNTPADSSSATIVAGAVVDELAARRRSRTAS